MPRLASLALLVIAAAGCALTAPPTDADAHPDATPTDAARDHAAPSDATSAEPHADAAAPTDAASAVEPGPRECEFVLAARSHLRPIATARSIGAIVESQTRLRYVAARNIERNGAVLTRVRTIEPAEREGYLFIERETLARCQRSIARVDPTALDEASVTIDGRVEQWRVRAVGAVHRECMGAIDEEGCGCWSHRGALVSDEPEAFVLERTRDGAVFERVPLRTHRMGAHFADDRSLRANNLARLARPSLIDVADYDHDGVAAEFVVVGDTISLGRERATLYGVGRDGHLRAIDPRNDGAPTEEALEAMRATPAGITVVWECGANLADTRELLRWSRGPEGLVMSAVETRCPEVEPFE